LRTGPLPQFTINSPQRVSTGAVGGTSAARSALLSRCHPIRAPGERPSWDRAIAPRRRPQGGLMWWREERSEEGGRVDTLTHTRQRPRWRRERNGLLPREEPSSPLAGANSSAEGGVGSPPPAPGTRGDRRRVVDGHGLGRGWRGVSERPEPECRTKCTHAPTPAGFSLYALDCALCGERRSQTLAAAKHPHSPLRRAWGRVPSPSPPCAASPGRASHTVPRRRILSADVPPVRSAGTTCPRRLPRRSPSKSRPRL